MTATSTSQKITMPKDAQMEQNPVIWLPKYSGLRISSQVVLLLAVLTFMTHHPQLGQLLLIQSPAQSSM